MIKTIRDEVVRILSCQTIKKVQKTCIEIAEQKDLKTFKKFVNNGPYFINTPKRKEILNGVQRKLSEKESTGVIIHGAYGSGKTIIMQNIAKLCDSPQEIGNHEYNQLNYGDTELDCFQISLEDCPIPQKFLFEIYKSFIKGSEQINEKDLIQRFEANKSNLTIEDLSQKLSEGQRKKLLGYFENPKSLEEISRVVKSLPAGEVNLTIEWFASYYRDIENSYPVIYIDEFEQMFRQVGKGESFKLKLIIQRMIRRAVTDFGSRKEPPYILFANTLALDEFTEVFEAERDLVDRVRESISYNIDLSEFETKKLFKELYRLYLIPLLEERKKHPDIKNWYDMLLKAKDEEDHYVYPFTNDALDFLLQVVEKSEDKEKGETVVRAFRDYKNILVTYLEIWEGNEEIDLEYLYKHSEDVKNLLRNLERGDINKLPGKESIENSIDSKYDQVSEIQKRALKHIAKKGILEYSENPVYFNKKLIDKLAKEVEIPLQEDEINDLIDQATSKDYFEYTNDRLVFHRDRLISESTVDRPLQRGEQVCKTIKKYNLEKKSILELWEKAMVEEFAQDLKDKITNFDNQYLTFDVAENYYYTEKVYFSVSPSGVPSQLTDKVDSPALHIVINLSSNDSKDEGFAEFQVLERNNRAPELIKNIEKKLNKQIQNHITDQGNSRLIKDIINGIDPRDGFTVYTLFLKLSLAKYSDYDLPPEVNDRIARKSSLTLLSFVNQELRGSYSYVVDKLGFKRKYPAKDILDLIYGIKHLDKEGELIYENPSNPKISVRSFGRAQRGKEAGEAFKEILKNKFVNEPFITKVNEDKYDVRSEYSARTKEIIKKIRKKLKEKEKMSFNQVVDLIFGTTKIDNVGKTMVYLLLVLGDYWEKDWVLKNRDKLILDPDKEIGEKKNKVKNILEGTIKKKVIQNVKNDKENHSEIKELKKEYNKINSVNSKDKLNKLENDLDPELKINYQDSEELISTILSAEVFKDSDIADYVNTIRPLSQLNESLLYLIIDDLENLLENICSAQEILKIKSELENRKEKIENLTNKSLSLDSIQIRPNIVDEIEDFMEKNDLNKNISQASINQDINDFLKNELKMNTLFELLNKTLNSIVPDIGTYNNEPDKEQLKEDLKKLKERFKVIKNQKIKEIKKERDDLQTLRKYISEENISWIKRGEKDLEKIEEIVKTEVDDFSYDDYEKHWETWKNRKKNIEEKSIDEDKIEEIISSYDVDLSPDDVLKSSREIDDLFKNLPKGEFKKLINNLDLDSTISKQLCASLIKYRLFSEDEELGIK